MVKGVRWTISVFNFSAGVDVSPSIVSTVHKHAAATAGLWSTLCMLTDNILPKRCVNHQKEDKHEAKPRDRPGAPLRQIEHYCHDGGNVS